MPALALPALAAGAVALAVAAGLWALAEQRASRRLRRALKASNARARTALGERDALLGAGREALVVWGRDGSSRTSYGEGQALLESCLEGGDAADLSAALDTLTERGAAFQIPVRDRHGRKLVARGKAVGSMAALWIEEPAAATESAHFRAILDALPVPVWLRDKGLALTWANHAFLSATGARDLDAARMHQVALDKAERELATDARQKGRTIEARRFAVVGGQRRALAFTEIPLGDAGVIGTAIDVTEVAAAEARLQRHVDAHADTLDKLATAVAIFGSDQKLIFFNRAFAQLWGLPENWLETHPADGEILDRLREMRRLPEQRDYPAWKRERLALYRSGARGGEEVWHIPDGRAMRVVCQPHPFGGLSFLYEDVTEQLALEARYNTLIKVQSATLDTLAEGVAVFGPDGRLRLSNAAFARLWDFAPDMLSGEPHLGTLADAAARRFGGRALWDRLVEAVVSGTMRPAGEIARDDGVILSLSLARLPDGATLATFADVTDSAHAESALRDRGELLEAADRLKSDFVRHLSHELRTPLNTILGFSEHLASGAPGPLNARQSEYVDAIVSGATTLRSLVNDILDLALVESGAMRLEMERIDLHALLAEVAGHAREWAARMGLVLDVDVAPAGDFVADPRRIRQVVFNLLSNAFKFTPRGGRVALSGRIAGEDVQICVKDDGPGLAPTVKARVFERFTAQGVEDRRPGAGLGLALVNRFLELHDGWVEIESGNGTLVRCHLPRRLQAAPDLRESERAYS